MGLPTGLEVIETNEVTETKRIVTVTLGFTDADLEDADTLAFYEAIKPKEEVAGEDLGGVLDEASEYPTV